MAAARVLPAVVRAKRLLRAERDIGDLMSKLDVAPSGHPAGGLEVGDLLADVRRALRLIGPRQDACLPRSLALFSLLTDRGYPVSFVSGIRRDGERLAGHAWLIVNGQRIEATDDHDATSRFEENFRYDNRALGA